MTRDYKLEISFAGFFFCIYVFLALFNASEYFVYFSIVFGLFGLIFIWNVRGGASFMSRLDFFLGLFGLA